jgi:protein TonB
VVRKAAICLLAAAAVLVRAATAQDFYETRLRAGEDSLRNNRPVEAISDLKIAAFGLLSRPPLLVEALASLAVAQERAGRLPEVQATLSRFVTVERRFPSWRSAPVAAGLKSEFERIAHARLPASVVASLPALSGGAPPRETGTPARQAEIRPTTPPAIATPRPEVETPTPESTAEDVPPRARTMTRPIYPPAALRAGVGGTVLLRVLVADTGAPLQVEVVQGIRPDLEAAAIGAVVHWTFEPAMKNGRPVRAWTNVAVPFQP